MFTKDWNKAENTQTGINQVLDSIAWVRRASGNVFIYDGFPKSGVVLNPESGIGLSSKNQ